MRGRPQRGATAGVKIADPRWGLSGPEIEQERVAEREIERVCDRKRARERVIERC